MPCGSLFGICYLDIAGLAPLQKNLHFIDKPYNIPNFFQL
jgi:hypothetical protein